MFNMVEKFAYIVVGLLIVAFGYHYVGKNQPSIPLPYKEQVFRLEKIILHKMEEIISDQETQMKK